ncbi:hypothetical protein SAMD00019534_126310 [Acytostelium subglobosum LB1]|uniref:hypothetical protein n=1 Tax=Acytostelium subglobosum LB1 TaxID=1410327 RepID=UPI000645120C|nr:hypothetical protein SAMD00019534_126310 [Acytostelium subglobosum LB1]GAM29455.1 hypothetical protein SAMD00019534_126310 [Acytostelium subglobosum LB1]|eukprot:XP_012747600.1 hypothetical protein SAMD00019534_126310 [Acytostelium subglobosum LB1]
MTIVRTSLTNNSIKNGQLVYGFFSIVSKTNCTLSDNMFVGSNLMRMTAYIVWLGSPRIVQREGDGQLRWHSTATKEEREGSTYSNTDALPPS